jgi:2'-5' RNA ligase
VILLEGDEYNYIRKLQVRLHELFKTKETLKLEPHMTIKYAFETNNLSGIEKYFDDLTSQIKPFKIKMNGVNFFEPNVAFVDFEKNEDLTNLHVKILNELGQQFFIQPSEFEGKDFHFHSTIAYKDIDKETFIKIKNELETEKPQFTFNLHKLGIYLKLNPNEDWFLYKTSLLK